MSVAAISKKLIHGGMVMVVCALLSFGAAAQEENPEVLDLHQRTSHSVMLGGVTQVLAMTDGICRIEVLPSSVRVTGLEPGDTVVYLWVGKERHEMLVRVGGAVEVQERRPTFGDHPEAAEAVGHGMVGASVQLATAAGTDRLVSHGDFVQWTQKVGPDQFSFSMDSQGSSTPGMSPVSVNHALLQYDTRNWTLSLMDSVLNLNGPVETQFRTTTMYNPLPIRGAQFEIRRGGNSYAFFAGSVLSQSFLRWGGAREIGGFTVRRNFTDKLSLFSMTAVTDQPPADLSPQNSRRTLTATQMFGAHYRLNPRWSFEGTAAGSLKGSLVEGGTEYISPRRTFYVRGTEVTSSFPLELMNLLQLRGKSLASTYTEKLSSRMFFAVTAQRTAIPGFIAGSESKTSFASATTSFLASRLAQLSLVYTQTSADVVTFQTSSRRAEFSLASQLFHGWSNAAQFEYGTLHDSTGHNSNTDLAIFDSLNGQIGHTTVSASFRHIRTNASLLSRLYSNLALLPPDARDAFLRDPQEFLTSPLLTPDIRALIAGIVPTDTQVRLSAQFDIRHRLNVIPFVAWDRDRANGPSSISLSTGYSLSFQLTRNLSLRSSLTQGMFWDPKSEQVRRDNILMFGFVRTLFSRSQVPFLSEWQHATISGSVFEDIARTGAPADDKHGVPNITVELDNGRKVTTNQNGQFQFSGLHPGRYRVRISLAQFASTIRVTTPIEVPVDVSMTHEATVNFGLVRLGRVFGRVFNDYNMDGVAAKDAPGIPGLNVMASTSGFDGSGFTSKEGAFEINDLPPGPYSLALDPATIPPGYMIPESAQTLTVGQAGNVYREIPLRAMRSVAGRIVLRQPAPETAEPLPANDARKAPNMLPIAGVRLIAGNVSAISDDEGNFLLRGLPAGDVSITVVPSDAVPAGVKIPTWKLQLPREPIELRNVNIVIQNPELAKLIASSERPGKKPPSAHPQAPVASPVLSIPSAAGAASRLPDEKREREKER